METISSLLDKQIKGERLKSDGNNDVTKDRHSRFNSIVEQAEENPEAEYQIALSEIEDNLPRLQEYVLSKGEQPNEDISGLAQQVFNLRQKEISDTAETLGVSSAEALHILENNEAEFYDEMEYMPNEFLGGMFAPVLIVSRYKKHRQHRKNKFDPDYDTFVSPELVSGIVNTIGEKLSASSLKRAAQGKPAGIIGTLSAGGASHYNALRDYFKAHPEEAQLVIKGMITDESQLKLFQNPSQQDKNILSANGIGLNDLKSSLEKNVADQYKKKTIPYIIGGVLLVVLIIVLVVMSKKK